MRPHYSREKHEDCGRLLVIKPGILSGKYRRTFPNMLKLAHVRPFILLGTQPIIQVLALYMGYLYGVVYLVLTTLPGLWTKRYHESVKTAGLNYISLGVGYLVGAQSTARLNDTIYKILKRRSGQDVGRPEFRLPLLTPGAMLVPVGLLWYGWSAQAHIHWIMPNNGIAIFGVRMKIAAQCMQTYAVDTYTLYAACCISRCSRNLPALHCWLQLPALRAVHVRYTGLWLGKQRASSSCNRFGITGPVPTVEIRTVAES